jgi:hypothetical protein
METVTLWHGTTESAAKLIATEGFSRADTISLIEQTAVDCSVDPAGTLAELRDAYRFVMIQDRRDDAVWFATDKLRADRWAQRAPEARWEALWGVWWLTHGGYDAMPAPWADAAAAAWHARHFYGDAPAVVQVSVPVSRLQDRYQVALPIGRAVELAESSPELSVAHPIPAEWVIRYETRPRRVDFIAAAGLLGLTVEELTRRVDTAEIAMCKRPDTPGLDNWYWKLSDLQSYLSSESSS